MALRPRPHKIRRPPVGNACGVGLKQISIAFDGDLFDRLRDRAIQEKRSFSQQVQCLCEWGLEANPGHNLKDE
jgi:hypothetical protein